MTLIDFLLARIADDEKQAVGPCDCAIEGLPLEHGYSCPVRVLAECDAKRRIVDECVRGSQGWPARDLQIGYEDILMYLALPYAGHPDYRSEWNPGPK